MQDPEQRAAPHRPRVLPPMWAGIVAVAMLGVDAACRSAGVLQPSAASEPWLERAGYALLAAGVLLTVLAAGRLVRHGTAVEPGHVPSALVTDGPYRVSRNPIYVGMATSLVGWALWLGQLLALLGPASFLAIVHWRIVRHEERLLADTFDDAWTAYAARVRRWL